MKPVDLTLTISKKIPTFPGSPQPMFIPWSDLKKDGYNLEMLFLSSHTGTHVDAPFHFVRGGKKIHQIDPGRFLRDATMIRIKTTPGCIITRSDITAHEKRFGAVAEGSTVIFATGWNEMPQRKGFFEKNPGISESAARYLVSLNTNMVGIDSPSIDVGSDKKFPAHHTLLKNDVLVLENLCNLHKVKRQHFKLAAFPLKMQGATGSPVRAIAF